MYAAKGGGLEIKMSALDKLNIADILSSCTYPGRGIVVGTTPDGENAVFAYFIMGRSENSRNRVFEEKENGEIITAPFDASKVEDPSLIIYSPVKVWGDTTVVTNGDQTDTIYDYLKAGKSFEEALETRCFEPDAPNFTPRISAALKVADGKYTYKMSILKSCDKDGSDCMRYTYAYPAMAGIGTFIHTYMKDGNPLPSFEGEPERVGVENDIDAYTKTIWDNLNADNKISLYVRYINIKTGNTTSRLINKNV